MWTDGGKSGREAGEGSRAEFRLLAGRRKESGGESGRELSEWRMGNVARIKRLMSMGAFWAHFQRTLDLL